MTSELYKTLSKIKGCGQSLYEVDYYRCYTGQTKLYHHPAWKAKTISCGGNEYGDNALRICIRCVQKAGIVW